MSDWCNSVECPANFATVRHLLRHDSCHVRRLGKSADCLRNRGVPWATVEDDTTLSGKTTGLQCLIAVELSEALCNPEQRSFSNRVLRSIRKCQDSVFRA